MTTTYSVTGPDGHSYSITGPKGATDDEVIAEIIRQNPSLEGGAPQPAPETRAPAPVAPQAPVAGPSGVQPPPPADLQPETETVVMQGADPRKPFQFGADAQSQLNVAAADPGMSWEDYTDLAKRLTEEGGGVFGGAGTRQQLDEYRQALQQGGQPGAVSVTNYLDTLDAPGATTTEGDGLFDQLQRGYQDAVQYGTPGFLARTYHDWAGTGMEELQQRFPDASPAQLEAIQEAIINQTQRGVREANTAATADDSMAPWLAGQVLGSAGIEDFVPGGDFLGQGLRGMAKRTGVAAGTNTGADAGYQAVDISEGVQDELNAEQLMLSPVVGAALHGGVEGVSAAGRGIRRAVTRPAEYAIESAPIEFPEGNKNTKAYRQSLNATVIGVDNHARNLTSSWTNAPTIETHTNFKKLDGVDDDALGYMGDDGVVRLNVENILDEAKARKTTPEAITNAVVFHESLGHYGLQQKFRDDLEGTLYDFYENSNQSFRSLVDKWMVKHPDAYKGHANRELRAAEEVLAEMSERGQLPVTIINRLKNVIKELMRSMWIDMKFSKREIETILGQAHRGVTGGKRSNVSGQGTRYMNAVPGREMTEKFMEDYGMDRMQAVNRARAEIFKNSSRSGLGRRDTSELDAYIERRVAERRQRREETEFNRRSDDLGTDQEFINPKTGEERVARVYNDAEARELMRRRTGQGNRYSKKKFANRSQFEDTDFDQKIDPDEPVTAYDLDGRLVGRYRNLNQARSLKPDHVYRSESGAFEMGPTGLNEDVARTFLYELGIPTDDLSGYQTMREAIDNRIDDRYIEWFQARPDEDGMYPVKPSLKKYGPKYMKKRSQEGDDLFESQNALDTVRALTEDYPVTTLSMDDLKLEAESRGLSATKLLNNKALDLGELPRRFMMYDIAAQQLNEKVTKLYHKIQSGQGTYNDRVNHAKALQQFRELVHRIFDEQGEAGRLLRSIQELDYTRKKIEGLQSTLEDFTDQGLKELLNDPEAYARFAKGIQDQMVDPKTGKLKENFYSVLNIPRAIMSSFDLSAPFRQALPFVGRKEFWKNIPTMFKHMFSEGAYDSAMIDITSRPNYRAMLEANLPLSGKQGKLSQREEAFQMKWADKVPGMAASERAYNGFLNKLRADVFDSIYNSAVDAGVDVTDKKFLKSLGSFVGAGTGRGKLGGVLQSAAPLLNALFFSPRLIQSRFQLLRPDYYVRLHPAVRKEAIKTMMSAASIVASVLGLSALAGADVETDPRSSDFGKIKVGNTRYDVGGGFNQFITLAFRIAPLFWGSRGKEKTATGELRSYGNNVGQKTELDAVGKFATNKASPITSFVLDFLRQQDAVGEEFNMTSAVASRVLPMYAQDIYEVAQEHGAAEGALRAAPGLFGVGVQNYTPNALDPEKEVDAPDSFEMQELNDGENEFVSVSDGVVTLKGEAKEEWHRRVNFYVSEWMRDELAKPEWKTMSLKEKADVIEDVRRDARRQTKTDMLPLLGVTSDEE